MRRERPSLKVETVERLCRELGLELVTIHQHKTRTAKSVPICAPLRALLQSLAPGVGNALVFRKADGSGFYPMEIQRAFAVALKLSGANPALSVHSIRHTVGSWLTIAGHPDRHVAEVLGHSLQSITRRYAHLGKGSLRPVLDDLVRIEVEGFRDHEKGEKTSNADAR
jgi:integrase